MAAAASSGYWYFGVYQPAKKYAADVLPIYENFFRESSATFAPNALKDKLDFDGARAVLEKRIKIIEKTETELSRLQPPKRMRSVHDNFTTFIRGFSDTTAELKERTFLINDTVLWFRSIDPNYRLPIEPSLPLDPPGTVIVIPLRTIGTLVSMWSERLPKAAEIAERWGKKEDRCIPSASYDSPGAVFCTGDIRKKWETAYQHAKEALAFFRTAKIDFNPFALRDMGGPVVAANIQKLDEVPAGFASELVSIISNNHAHALVDYGALRGLDKQRVELADEMKNLKEQYLENK